MKNPFESLGQWYKANLHTHTTTSDGNATVKERIQQYRDRDYSVLAITDHSQTNNLDGLSSREFLLINGMEIGDQPDESKRNPFHLVCLNIPHGFKFPEGADANTLINLTKEAGGEVIVGHPYWNGHHLNHLLETDGYMALEVFNTTCHSIGKGISSVYWDDLLEYGRIIPAVASDDVHGDTDIFQGWTMIKTEELSVKAVMEALKTGCFYSSCGPVIKDLRIKDNKVTLHCSPVVEVNFMCQRANGLRLCAEDGKTITNAEFPLNDYLKYVRVEVVDAKGKRAWSNPFIL